MLISVLSPRWCGGPAGALAGNPDNTLHNAPAPSIHCNRICNDRRRGRIEGKGWEMDTIRAFAIGMANKGKPLMVFDWDKAAELIREHGAKDASAGLAGDWEWTGGEILADGVPIPEDDACVYLASTWATPELQIGEITIDCWRYQDATPDGAWDADTYWPESARKILGGDDDK